MLLHFTIANDTEDGFIFTVDVSPEITVQDLKALLEAETEIPMTQQSIIFEGQSLDTDTLTLKEKGITEEGCLLQIIKPKSEYPLNSCANKDSRKVELMANTSIETYQSLGFNVAEQRRIEEAIHQANIAANLQTAIEHHPEAFGSVIMLYVHLTVNGHSLIGFIDCGAQATIMSMKCAEKCGLSRLVDKRFGGIARGVGERKIVGRIHAAEIAIGGLHLACSFNVLEDGSDGIDLLFGLDMLRRHQACIDLSKNALVIHNVEIPFLSESEIPKQDK